MQAAPEGGSLAEGAADQTSARRAREEIYKGAVDNAGRNRLTLAAILNRPSHRVPIVAALDDVLRHASGAYPKCSCHFDCFGIGKEFLL